MAIGEVMYVVGPNNSLYVWGYASSTNDAYVMGNTSVGTVASPKLIDSGEDWSSVIVGGSQAYALKKDGTLWHIGSSSYANGYGLSTSFKRISEDNDWKYIACSEAHMMAIKEDGTMYAMGNNASGKTGLGQVSGGQSTLQLVNEDKDWKIVSCGSGVTLALKEDNSLWAAGNNSYAGGSAGARFSKILDGPIRSISTSTTHSALIDSEGSLFVTGVGTYGKLGTGSATSVSVWTKINSDIPWKYVACGTDNTYGIKEDGTFWAVGRGLYSKNGQEDKADTGIFKQIGYETYWDKLAATNNGCYIVSLTKEVFFIGGGPSGYRMGHPTLNESFFPTKLNISEVNRVPDIVMLKNYPILQPATAIVDCQATEGLQYMLVAGSFPQSTHTRLLLSLDGLVWKYFDSGLDQWVETPLESASEKGMTVESFEALDVSRLSEYENIPFKIAITMWTETNRTSPKIRGIDAFVSTANATPSVQSISVGAKLLKSEMPKYFASRDDGATWKEIQLDALEKLDDLPEGKDLRIKVVLQNGLEIHGLSYSWA